MFTAILWDYDGTLANTPVKNIAVTRAVLGRLDPALLDPLPEALSSLAAYQAANYRWRNWRELYQHALRVPADRLDEAGALWGPCQLADRTLPPLFGGLLEVLPRLAALAPMGICSQNDSGNIRAALAAHGAADCFAAVVGHADVDFARQKPDPAAFLACLDRLGLREGRFAYIGDHAGDIAFGRNAQAALRAMGRAAEVVCVAAAWGGAPSVDLAAADAVAARPADLPDLLAEIKTLGFLVKLDTNGSHPERLRAAVEAGAVDYVAMDVKNSPACYAQTAGVPGLDLGPIRESVAFLLAGHVDYEFRTTVVKQFHDRAAFQEIGPWLAGARRYFLQSYEDRDTVLCPGLSPCSREELEDFASAVRPFVPAVALRGV